VTTGTTATALIAAALVAGCGPGDGSSLDADGRSIARPWAPSLGSRYGSASFPATWTGVQTGFFATVCAECHAGDAAPKGLDLAADDAWDRLVGRPSSERPEILLVAPGDPGASYLVMKLEGASGIAGRQMPRNRAARPAEEIETIAQWIRQGAARD
jgi:hypothetical protein